MKAIWRLGVPLLAVLILGSSVLAETKMELSGQVRVRSEFDGKSFRPHANSLSYLLMRTRVNLKAVKNEYVHAFVQFQDSRTLGGWDQFGNWQSGTLNDGKGVDIHQAYIQVDRLWLDDFGFRAGRFEFNLGNQRVFGAVGWHNVGRSWEGIKWWYRGDQFKLTGFFLKAEEANSTSDYRDFDILGLHLGFDRAGLELFGVIEIDFDNRWVVDNADNDLERTSVGFFWKRHHNQIDFELNGVYQLGNVAGISDISAFMAAGEIGYSFEGEKNARVAIGVDYASGDDNPIDSSINSYNNLYYTGHKFRGYMDYFVGSDPYGLMDLMLRFKVDPASKWTLKGDFHYFTAAQNYLDPGDLSETKDIGMEFDFSLATTSIAGVELVAGTSIFLPEDSFVRKHVGDPNIVESESGFWSYGQAIVNF